MEGRFGFIKKHLENGGNVQCHVRSSALRATASDELHRFVEQSVDTTENRSQGSSTKRPMLLRCLHPKGRGLNSVGSRDS